MKISHNSASSRPPALSAYRCWHSHAIATRCGRAISILALFAASLALAPVMLAQGSDNVENLSLEELLHVKIVTASKFSQSASDAPSAVTVITRDEIQKYGYRTLADLLQTVRGFYITYDRNYTYVGVRGFQRPGDYNSRVLLLIDGHRINDNIYEQGFLGNDFPVDLDMVERVEIVRGPSSSLYGTSAFFGVINVITRKAKDIQGAEVAFEPGSFGTYRGRATYGAERGRLGLVLSSSFYGSRGADLYFPEFNSPSSNNGIAHQRDGEDYNDFLATLTYRDFTFQGLFSQREKGIPTGSYETVFNANPGSGTLDGQRFFRIEYQRTVSKWEVTADTSLDRHVYNGSYIYSGDDPSAANVVNKDLGWGTWWTGELRAQRTLARNTITVGSEFQDNLQQDQLSYYVEPFLPAVSSFPAANANWSFYGQDELSLTPKVSVSAGVRYDHYYEFGGTVNPRLGVIYHVSSPTTLKFLYGTAFRAPSPYEMFYYSGAYIANLKLNPEKMISYEGVLERRLGNNFVLTCDVFRNDVDGLITQVVNADGSIEYTNSQDVDGIGAETEIAGQLPAGLQFKASYAFAPGEDEVTHRELTNSAHNLAKVNLSVPIFRNRMALGFDAQYTGARLTLAGSKAAGYPMFNVTLLSRNVSKHMDFSASLYNVLDRKYWDPALPDYPMDKIQQDGRNFRVKLTWHSNADSQ